jgi:hypothetical protein
MPSAGSLRGFLYFGVGFYALLMTAVLAAKRAAQNGEGLATKNGPQA